MRLAVLAFVCLAFAGCPIFGRHHYVESRRPILPVPERPELKPVPAPETLATEDELREAYQNARENLVALLNRDATFEEVIRAYNKESLDHNIKNGYSLPPEPPQADPEPTPEQ